MWRDLRECSHHSDLSRHDCYSLAAAMCARAARSSAVTRAAWAMAANPEGLKVFAQRSPVWIRISLLTNADSNRWPPRNGLALGVGARARENGFPVGSY
jgi:hypothetical protein